MILKSHTNYSVLSEDILLKNFISSKIVEINNNNNVDKYPSMSTHRVIVSDEATPSDCLFVISFVEREDFIKLNLDDFSFKLKLLCNIFNLDKNTVSRYINKNHNKDLLKIMILISHENFKYDDLNTTVLNVIKKFNTELSFKNKIENVLNFLMNPTSSSLKHILDFYYKDDINSLMWILESLISGNIANNNENNPIFVKRVIEISVAIIKSDSNESAMVNLMNFVN